MHSRTATAPVELTRPYQDAGAVAELAAHVVDSLTLDDAGQIHAHRGAPWISVLGAALDPHQASILRDGLAELLTAIQETP